MKSILEPDFKYDDSANTDIRKRFNRIRRELRAKADAEAKERAEADANKARVLTIFENRRERKA